MNRLVRRLAAAASLAGVCLLTMPVGRTSVRPVRRVGGRMAAVGAGAGGQNPPGLVVAQGGDVPRNLGPDQYFQGTPWRGQSGRTVSVAELMAREALEPPVKPLRVARELDGPRDPKLDNPAAPAVARWPPRALTTNPLESLGARNPQTVSTSWTGIHASESGYVPPDSIGAVGPTQVVVMANGRIKVFDKAGTLGGLDVSDNTFFASVRGSSSVSDPHVRYDRLSGRWFITEINVANASNLILIAVSSGSTITNSSSFAFFQFQHDTVGATPNVDTGGFADYDTLGVDANALYVGINEFSSSDSYIGTSAYVVNKADLLGGTLTVTAFRGLASGSGAGPYTPQGVDNDDPAATEGYFIGVDNAAFSKLQIRRITNPGGTPSISGNISLTVPTTYYPIDQPQLGTTRTLSAIDDRLYAAMIRKNTLTGVANLWTAHNVRVNSSGVSSSAGSRNAMRWYHIGTLTATPTLIEAGTLFDSAATNPRGYWMGSVAVNGQGHAAIVSSFASAIDYAGVAVAGRLAWDVSGTTQSPSVVVTGAGPYVDWTSYTSQRWGDYSQVTVDPADNQTMWAFEDYAYGTSTTDAWGVRAVKLLAPPPATPSSLSPSSINSGVASTSVTLTGASSSGSAFYDPGSGFSNRLAVAVTGGVTVNSVTFVDETTITINVSTVGASAGTKNVTVTNPDGQQTTGTGILTVTAPSATFTDDPLQTGVTTVKAIHITELRQYVDTLRSRYNLSTITWTDSPIVVGTTTLKAQHIVELRTALDAVYDAAHVTRPTYTAIGPFSPISAVYINELRAAITAIY